jgi:FKBP-type peptidyl-prolyl cis-trans isomerase FkpA
MKSTLLIARAGTVAGVFAAASCGGSGGGGKVDLSSDDGKTYYALGVNIGGNLSHNGAFSGLTMQQIDDVKEGIGDALANKPPQVDMATYGQKVQQMMMARMQQAHAADAAQAVEEKKKGEAFQETAAKEAGAEKTASGLIFKSTKPGTGASPKATDTVKVSYEGKLIDGTVFDASDKHGGPATFQLNRVVPCWTEGVQKMKVGEKAQLVCPSTIAYGDNGSPPRIPGGATLIFTVELLEINPAPAPGAAGAMAMPQAGPPGSHPMMMHPPMHPPVGPRPQAAAQPVPPPPAH